MGISLKSVPFIYFAPRPSWYNQYTNRTTRPYLDRQTSAMGLAQPPWDCLTRVLAVLGRAVFCFAGAGMVIGTFPCYVSRDAALQMVLDEDSMPPKAWQALGSTSDGKLWQDFIIYYARTEFAAEMVLGLVWLYFGLMPRSLMPYHVRAAAYGLFFVMCAVGYGEDALQGGNPFQPGGGAEIATNEFSSMFLPLGVIGVACFLGEWARVARIEKAHEDSAAKGALPANYGVVQSDSEGSST